MEIRSFRDCCVSPGQLLCGCCSRKPRSKIRLKKIITTKQQKDDWMYEDGTSLSKAVSFEKVNEKVAFLLLIIFFLKRCQQIV